MIELTILVPAYCERENLARHLPLLVAFGRRCRVPFEILVVDDGSRDDSAELVAELARSERALRLVRHPRNLGPGAALPTALFWARGRWLLFVPADLACEPDQLDLLWAAHRGCELVVGLRSDRRDYGAWRRALSVGYIALVRALSGSRVRQFNYLLLVRRGLFARLPLHSRGVFVTAEIILRAEGAGCKLVEVPLRYRPRRSGRARGASPRALGRCALELVRFFAEGRSSRDPG